ncbi:MAG: Class I peptide chain release factor [candidate division TM6 bacterium GW2011_GWF2_32_72]|nr:MAG: Class I peptide chain release factor [candidate division TM6 bacterium GW2011_GWF2_32_72]
MDTGLHIKNGITIPENELEVTASRSGGPGGQHVNKSDTKITVRWSVINSTVLNEIQKQRLLENLKSRLTTENELVIQSSSSRSQQQNKKEALDKLAQEIRKGLYVPKKRMKTVVSKHEKEARLKFKKIRGDVKKMRSKKIFE